MRPDPAIEGWLPDGERSSQGSPRPLAYGTAYADAVRTRFFVAITLGYLLVLGSQVGAIQQLVRLAEERTDKSTASFAVLFLAGTSVVARLVGGRVVARIPMAGFTVTLAALQSVAMVAIAFSESRFALFAAIIVFGATVGNILMLQPLLIAERFGVVDYPRIFSRSQFIMMLGTALGPLAARLAARQRRGLSDVIPRRRRVLARRRGGARDRRRRDDGRRPAGAAGDMSGQDDLVLRPATEQARLVRLGEVSARELLAAHLDRIERGEPDGEHDRHARARDGDRLGDGRRRTLRRRRRGRSAPRVAGRPQGSRADGGHPHHDGFAAVR